VLVNVLEGLNETQGLVDVAADGSVIESGLHEHALGVDDEQAAVGVAGVLDQHAVLAGNGLSQISHEGNVQTTAKTASLAWGVDPGQMGILGVDRHSNDLPKLSHKHIFVAFIILASSAYVLILRNSSTRSLKARISVGHTKVKSRG